MSDFCSATARFGWDHDIRIIIMAATKLPSEKWGIAMVSIEKYEKYRRIGMKLNNKMMESCLDRNALLESARLLGIGFGDVLLFDSEEETSVLMDFALNEYRMNDKNIVEIYREKVGWQNEIEREILDALLSSYTSLFKIISISEEDSYS